MAISFEMLWELKEIDNNNNNNNNEIISKNSRIQYSVSNAVQFEMYIDLGDDFTYQKPHVILIINMYSLTLHVVLVVQQVIGSGNW